MLKGTRIRSQGHEPLYNCLDILGCNSKLAPKALGEKVSERIYQHYQLQNFLQVVNGCRLVPMMALLRRTNVDHQHHFSQSSLTQRVLHFIPYGIGPGIGILYALYNDA